MARKRIQADFGVQSVAVTAPRGTVGIESDEGKSPKCWSFPVKHYVQWKYQEIGWTMTKGGWHRLEVP